MLDETGPALYALALRITGAAADAEDVVEQTVLEALRAPGVAAAAAPFPSLARRCRDLALVRSGKRAITSVRRRPPAGLRGGVAAGDMHCDLRAERAAAAAAMAGLAETDRRALEMAYFEGFRVIDVAACERCPPGEVIARLRRALAAFAGPGPARDRIALSASPAGASPALRARLLDAAARGA